MVHMKPGEADQGITKIMIMTNKVKRCKYILSQESSKGMAV